MTRPIVSDLTERIYDLLEPLQADDAAYGYGMLILASAAAAMMEEAYGWSSGDDGTEPWQHLLDTSDLGAGVPNDFLAQLLGLAVRVMEPSLIIAIMDQNLALMRGTVAYLEAVMFHMLGVDSIGVYERVDDSLAPDPTGLVIRSAVALTAQQLDIIHLWKPAGLISHVIDSSLRTYFDLPTDFGNYTTMDALASYYAIGTL